MIEPRYYSLFGGGFVPPIDWPAAEAAWGKTLPQPVRESIEYALDRFHAVELGRRNGSTSQQLYERLSALQGSLDTVARLDWDARSFSQMKSFLDLQCHPGLGGMLKETVDSAACISRVLNEVMGQAPGRVSGGTPEVKNYLKFVVDLKIIARSNGLRHGQSKGAGHWSYFEKALHALAPYGSDIRQTFNFLKNYRKDIKSAVSAALKRSE